MSALRLPPLLDELLRTGAPAGYEGPAAAVWREAAAPFAEVSGDGVGSSIARVGERKPLLAMFGHIDEIGLIVTHVDEHGCLGFEPLGFWDPQILIGQRVEIHGRQGMVPGVIGRKSIGLLSAADRKKVVELHEMHIDIGVDSEAKAAKLVLRGDPAVIAAEPVRLAEDRVASRALDNRLGAYAVLEALRRCAEGDGPGGSVAAVASVQEELGLLGARTSAFEVRPDVAIAVDGVYGDGPSTVDPKVVGGRHLGSGPVIGRGPTLSTKVSDFLIETAEAEGIEYSVSGYGLSAIGLSTGTDADAVQISRSGVPTGVVSIPLRYVHSPVEMVDLRDLEATVKLLTAACSRLTADLDFSS